MIFDSPYEAQRIQKAQALLERGINPYGNDVVESISIAQLKNDHRLKQDDPINESLRVYIKGRIKFFRVMGKASFLQIEDQNDMVQIYVSRDDLPEGFYNEVVKKMVEVGDFIQVGGFVFLTQKGEFTLHVKDFRFLTKAISPLPEKYHGLQDQELRYRQRYLDLIMNKDTKVLFQTRSQIVSLIRRFFEDKHFLEVETPMLHPIAGGANAKPFITKHNALGEDRYLRIAPELYLKRLIVGGFEAVFEINRNFRNEGIDHTHNPEFSMLEFYWAYKKADDLIALTEELFGHLFEALGLDDVLESQGMRINCARPFKRVSYKEAIVEIGGVDRGIVDDRQGIIGLLKSKGLEVNEKLSLGHLQAELFDEFVEDKLIDPTFITDFPISISPLARRDDANPEVAQRFELFVGKKEIANGFSELNDPVDQYERFEAQIQAKNSGDDEAHEMDSDYVRALGYGMPPTAGEGIGIDRLVMLLCNQSSIKDVLLFPALRHIKSQAQQLTDNDKGQEQ